MENKEITENDLMQFMMKRFWANPTREKESLERKENIEVISEAVKKGYIKLLALDDKEVYVCTDEGKHFLGISD